MNHSVLRTALFTTALVTSVTFVVPTVVEAQNLPQICTDLRDTVQNNEGELSDSGELLDIAEQGKQQPCRDNMRNVEAYLVETGAMERGETKVLSQSGEQSNDGAVRTSEQTTEEVTLQEEVSVAGQVDVSVPKPRVTVEKATPEVTVTQQTPDVQMNAEAPRITVRQKPITVRMQAPTITIEQEAPEIIVTMPDPELQLANAEPQVEVRQAKPTVTVEMGEPQVNMNVRPVRDGEEGEVRTNVSSGDGQDGGEAPEGTERVETEGQNADVFVRSGGEPNVTVQQAENGQQSRTTKVSFPEPEVTFEQAEYDFQMEGEPQVEVNQTGEPKVTLRRAGEEQQNQQSGQQSNQNRQQASNEQSGGQQSNRQQSSDQQQASSQQSGDNGDNPAADNQLTAEELSGRTLYSARNNEIGDIERFVRMDGEVMAIVSHGGFFGIGDKEVAIPVSELRWEDEQLVAPQMSDEDIEDMQERDASQGQALAEGEPVGVLR